MRKIYEIEYENKSIFVNGDLDVLSKYDNDGSDEHDENEPKPPITNEMIEAKLLDMVKQNDINYGITPEDVEKKLDTFCIVIEDDKDMDDRYCILTFDKSST